MPVKVGIFGFGTIGKRIADAIKLFDDFEIIGVLKVTPDYEAEIATHKGYNLYTYEENIKEFEKSGIPVKGNANDLIKSVDLVFDATPGGKGKDVKEKFYMPVNTKVIFQGGEKATVAEVSFNALANYEKAIGKKYVRVVSCNTTALARLISSFLLHDVRIKRVRVYLVRRGADPKEHKKGPINDVIPDPLTVPSHHGPDVKTVIPDVDIVTMAVAVPVTIMHLHMVNIELHQQTTRQDVIKVLEETPRMALLSGAKKFTSLAQVIEWARDVGKPRGDFMENAIFEDSVTVIDGNDVYLTMGVHQESIVIPENVDAARAMLNLAPKWSSIEKTDKTLNLTVTGKKYS